MRGVWHMRVIGLWREETLVCWIIHFLLISHTLIFHFLFCLHHSICSLLTQFCSWIHVPVITWHAWSIFHLYYPLTSSPSIAPISRPFTRRFHHQLPPSFDHVHSSVLRSHPLVQLLGLRRRRRPGPGSAPDGDGRHRAAPGRHCAGRHQPARHDR